MKTKKDIFDRIAYICLCIASFGMVVLFRVIISEAIRQSFEEDKKE